MSDLKQNPQTETPSENEEWVHVGNYSNLEQANDHGLVILAMGEACRVTEGGKSDEYVLEAELHPIERVSAELDAYGKDSKIPIRKKRQPDDKFQHTSGWWVSVFWVLALIAIYIWQYDDPSLVEKAASSSLGLIGGGEWWRPFTGLFLHANVGHLVGNLVGGVIFAILVARTMGVLLGWSLILTCGTLGNVITSLITYPDSFVSLGASTAVFAALGILSGHGVAETLRENEPLPWLRIFVPVLAGVIMLGWLGGGHDPNTDVLGHVFGFGTGLVAGSLVGVLQGKHRSIETTGDSFT